MMARREGFTIVEVIVAMVVLAVLLTMMGGLTFSVSRQSLRNATVAQGQAFSMELVNRYSTLPFTSLQNYTDTVTVGKNRYARRAQVTTHGDSTVVVLTTVPLQHQAPQVQVRLVRSRNAAAQNPLCSPSC